MAGAAYTQWCRNEGLREQSVVRNALVAASTSLDFSSQYVGPKQARAIATTLYALPDLLDVNLAGVGLSDDVVELICEVASSNNPSLATMDVSGNPMLTDRAAIALLELATRSPTLTSIVLSNATTDGVITDISLHRLSLRLDCNRMVKAQSALKSTSYTAPSIARKYLELTTQDPISAEGTISAGVDHLLPDEWECATNADDFEDRENTILSASSQPLKDPSVELEGELKAATALAVLGNESIGVVQLRHHGVVDQARPTSMHEVSDSLRHEETKPDRVVIPTVQRPGSIDCLPRHASVDEVLPQLLYQQRLEWNRRRRESDEATSSFVDGNATDSTSTKASAKMKFVDPEFPPNPFSLCSTSGLSMLQAEHLTEGISWCRLSELETAAPTTGKPPVFSVSSSHDVECVWYQAVPQLAIGKGSTTTRYGLSNKWFTNALTSVQGHAAIVNSLLVRSYPELGLYVVRLFKNGSPVTVVVDDFVPCIKDSGPNGCVSFLGAHVIRDGGPIHNIVWASVVEKAYAKLHGGYDRLGCGSLASALRDLTNGYPHKWVWNLDVVSQLVRTSSSLEVIVEWIDQQTQVAELVLAQPSARGTSAKAALEACGLLPNQPYLVTMVQRNVGQDRYTLIKLRTPKPGILWNGRFGHRSAELTSAVAKEMFLVDVTEGSSSLTDFVMTIEDFLSFFSSITRLIFPDTSTHLFSAFRHCLPGYWVDETAGGLLDAPSWTENPAFYLRAESKYTTVVVELSQRDARLLTSYTASSQTPMYDTIQLVAFVVEDDDEQADSAADGSWSLYGELSPMFGSRRRRVLPLTRIVGAVAATNSLISMEVPVHPRKPLYIVVANSGTVTHAIAQTSVNTTQDSLQLKATNPSSKGIVSFNTDDSQPNGAPIGAVSAVTAEPSEAQQPPRGSYRYNLRCISSDPISLEPVIDPAGGCIRQRLTSSWKGESAAGRLTVDSEAGSSSRNASCRNPQFIVTFSRTVLRQKMSGKILRAATDSIGDPSSEELAAIVLTQECLTPQEATRRRRSQLLATSLNVLFDHTSAISRCGRVDAKTEFERRRSNAIEIRLCDLKPEYRPVTTNDGCNNQTTPTNSTTELEEVEERRSMLVIPTTWGIGEDAVFDISVFAARPFSFVMVGGV